MNPILSDLYERYYESKGTPEQVMYISSHWEKEGQLLLAERNASGEIVPMPEYNWGCRWKSLLGRGFGTVHKYVHFPGLSHKARIFRLTRLASKICTRMGLDLTHTIFRQVCTAELLERHLYRTMPDERLRILVIGDGAGVLSGLLKAMFPTCSVALGDIGKSLLYQAYHCQRAHPDELHVLVGEETDFGQADFLYCPTENLHALEKYKFDIAVNVASMQEMNVDTIARYFDFLRKCLRTDNLFYCCNQESKALVGGELPEFYSYPWRPNDEVLLEGECPWHRYVVGRHRNPRGPKILGFRIPFFSYYDGPILHRLAVMATARAGYANPG